MGVVFLGESRVGEIRVSPEKAKDLGQNGLPIGFEFAAVDYKNRLLRKELEVRKNSRYRRIWVTYIPGQVK